MLQINSVNQGDCLELMKDIQDQTIDMILTDLPYGVTARNEWDEVIDQEKLWQEWYRIKKETTPIVLTAIQPFSSFLVNSNIKDFKYEWIWQKSKGAGFLNAKKQPLRNHEHILVFYEKLGVYNPQFLRGKPYQHVKQKTSNPNYREFKTQSSRNDSGQYYPKTILHISNAQPGTMHPTQKPTELFEYLIKTYTNENAVVLDCCAGSGTTSIACINTNRNYICIEKEQKYVEIINKRLAKKSNQKLEVFCN